MRHRGAGSDGLALRGLRLAARARAAARGSSDVRRRRRQRGVAISRLAAARRARRARGAADGAGRPGHARHGQTRGRPADRVVQGPWHGGDRVVVRAHGVQEIVVDSSGNAGASFAAYAARASIQLRMFVPADASPAKLLGARPWRHRGGLPGPRSAAGEAARRSLEGAGPDVAYARAYGERRSSPGPGACLRGLRGARRPGPGRGGRAARWRHPVLGVHLGFTRLRTAGLIDRLPRLVGVQSDACAPLARAFRTGEADAVAVTPGSTIAKGIRDDRPPRSRQILAAIRDTGGDIVEVSDEDIRASLRALLARAFSSSRPRLPRTPAWLGRRSPLVPPGPSSSP